MKKVVMIIFAVLAVGLAGWEYIKMTDSDTGTQYPMIVFKNKEQLWQVVTYENKPVTAMSVRLQPKYKQSFRNVYLNFRSQFVFSDATPILIMGEPIFWNSAGDVVTYHYKTIRENLVFYVDDKGMKPHTAMTLFELKNTIKGNYLKEIDTERSTKAGLLKFSEVRKNS